MDALATPSSTRIPFVFPLFVMVVLALATAALYVHAQQPTGYYLLAFQATDTPVGVKLLTPVDGLHIQGEESIVFTAQNLSREGTYSMRLYVRKGTPPNVNGEEYLVVDRTVRASQTFTYTHVPNPAWGSGTYYWKILTTNLSTGERAESETWQYNVVSLTDIMNVAEADAGNTTGTGSCDGGAGGHESDSTGEKSFMGFTLNTGETTFLRFNKAEQHAIQKIVIRSEKKLEPNGLIIHQEFEDETEYTLPTIDAVYKTIHVHQTHPWNENSFYVTFYFRVPKKWVEKNERKRDEVHLQLYENGKWAPNPTFFEKEEGGYYLYQSTLHGLPPFAIGACHKTRQGRIIG